VIGLHARAAIEQNAINARVYEALGCQSFFVSDFVPTLGELFDVGRELVSVREGDDVVGLIEGYLEDQPLRESIAVAGHAKVLKRDTISDRAAQFHELLSRL
jgi:spore maturation protein CgeB